jgi:nicotinamidase-related amidase
MDIPNHTYTEREVSSLARKAYSSNPSFGVKRERCALLVIDMQDEFVRPGWTPFWVPEATKRVRKIRLLLEFCRRSNVPVIFTAFAKTNNYLDRPASGDSMPNRFPGTPSQVAFFRDGKIWHELLPIPNEIVIHKPSYGAFYDTPLETILKRMDKDTVILCGTLTNYCVGTTARQAYERGFKVVVGIDVTATDDPDLQEAELRTLRKGFAMVLSVDEIIQKLRGSAHST